LGYAVASSQSAEQAMEEKLDLAGHFSPKYTLPEPVASDQAARDIDKLGLIGEAALKDKGFFTRMVVEDRSTSRKIMDPRGVRVLIVDDDESTALLIQKALHTFGMKTLLAHNRQEIVNALGAKPLPHLVLLDVLMPDANGFDVLNRIRHHPALVKLPVLMLTALGDRKDITRGLLLGADGYLTKPVLPSVLMQAIETVLAG
jgi:two-component system OmpR family response regulator